MSPPPIDGIVEHDGRLGILCHLIDDGPLTVAQLSIRTDMPLAAIHYHLTLLKSVCLAKKADDPAIEESLYTATLNGQPNWVWEAVQEHRQRLSRMS